MPTTNVVSIASGPHRARTRARRDELVLAHLSLADGIARHIARNLPAGKWVAKDLVGEANLGLIRAATSWRPRAHGGVPFACWARLCIRGAVLDAIRKRWCDGSHKHGVQPLLWAMDEDLREDDAPGAEQRIDAERRRKRVARAIATLPAEEVAVLERRYGAGEETFAEIGARLAMNRYRVAALHASAIAGLRRELRAA
jgi:RNA polymerase sigma factor (sigma-70 family)